MENKVYPDWFGDKLRDYDKFDNLLNSNHEKAFQEIVKNIFEDKYSNYSYSVQNYCYLASKIASDMLFTEQPTIYSDDPAVEAEINRLWNKLNMQRVCLEAALVSSALGDAYFKTYLKDGEIKLRVIKPQRVCPTFTLDEDVKSFLVMSVMTIKGDRYMYVQEHMPGAILHKAYQVGQVDCGIIREVSLESIGIEVDPIESTGIDEFLITHVPNIRTGDEFFGLSDYVPIEGLQEALNRRATQISRVLSMHSSPILCLPGGFIDEHGKIDVRDLEYIQLPEGMENQKPQFITWEAYLSDAFNEIEKMTNALFTVADIPLFMNAGNIPESGSALRLKMIRTTALVARKGIYFEEALKSVFKTMLALENEYLNTSFNVDANIEIEFSDGLPDETIDSLALDPVGQGDLDVIVGQGDLDVISQQAKIGFVDEE